MASHQMRQAAAPWPATLRGHQTCAHATQPAAHGVSAGAPTSSHCLSPADHRLRTTKMLHVRAASSRNPDVHPPYSSEAQLLPAWRAGPAHLKAVAVACSMVGATLSSFHSNSTTSTVMLSALMRSSHSYSAASSTRLQAMWGSGDSTTMSHTCRPTMTAQPAATHTAGAHQAVRACASCMHASRQAKRNRGGCSS